MFRKLTIKLTKGCNFMKTGIKTGEYNNMGQNTRQKTEKCVFHDRRTNGQTLL